MVQGAAASPPGSARPSEPPAAASPAPDPKDNPIARARDAAAAKRFDEAEGICRDILGADPKNAEALGMWGLVASAQGRIEPAISLFEQALAIAPDNGAWLGNLCELYRMVYRLDEALQAGMRALQLNARGALHPVRLAKVFVDLGRTEQALSHFLAALAIDPDDASAHLGLGQVLLATGNFRPGWIEYEWRNKLEQAKGMVPRMRAPVWNGMALPKGRILLVGDQGFGDVFHFARYIPLVAARCEAVAVACSNDLKPLLARIAGVGDCFSNWQDAPGFTAYALMSSLPFILGTELATIPARVPYLSADPAKVASWDRLLRGAAEARTLNVGLCWAGRPNHPNDRRRSLRLSQLTPLAKVRGVRLVSLHKNLSPDDAKTLAQFKDLVDLSKELTDFDETAAVIGNLDLVITADSAVAHLAGALGRPVWMLTPRPSDWRWLLERQDSPWYPTLRLFRQPRPGAWPEVVAAVRQELQQWADAAAEAPTTPGVPAPETELAAPRPA